MIETPGHGPRPVGVARSGRDRAHEFPRRSRRIAPGFTEAEHATVAAAAARVGLTPTGFCATATLTQAETVIDGEAGGGAPPTPAMLGDVQTETLAAVQAELAELRTAVVRVGTNLNQAMAAFHATGAAPVWLAHVVERCGQALDTVDQAASRLHRRLS